MYCFIVYDVTMNSAIKMTLFGDFRFMNVCVFIINTYHVLRLYVIYINESKRFLRLV